MGHRVLRGTRNKNLLSELSVNGDKGLNNVVSIDCLGHAFELRRKRFGINASGMIRGAQLDV